MLDGKIGYPIPILLPAFPCKNLVDNGINYQPQRVNAGFLNHQQYCSPRIPTPLFWISDFFVQNGTKKTKLDDQKRQSGYRSDGRSGFPKSTKSREHGRKSLGIYISLLLLLMEEILHQLRLVVYPSIYKVLYLPGGAGFLPPTVSLLYNILCHWQNSYTTNQSIPYMRIKQTINMKT